MEALSVIAKKELAQLSRDESPTSLVLQTSLPDATGEALLCMMASTIARYPNQEISEATQEMNLVQWEEMTAKYSLDIFRDALLKVIRESRFFPDPLDMEAHCRFMRRAQIDAEDSRRHLDQLAKWKAQKEREDAEDAGKPKPEKTETEKRLDGLLDMARVGRGRAVVTKGDGE